MMNANSSLQHNSLDTMIFDLSTYHFNLRLHHRIPQRSIHWQSALMFPILEYGLLMMLVYIWFIVAAERDACVPFRGQSSLGNTLMFSFYFLIQPVKISPMFGT